MVKEILALRDRREAPCRVVLDLLEQKAREIALRYSICLERCGRVEGYPLQNFGCIKRGVKSLAVFGSVAPGEASGDSDLDLLVEFERPVGLFDFIRLKRDLEQSIGCPVDLVTPDALHPRLKDRILKEAVYVR